jgi:phospholipase C
MQENRSFDHYFGTMAGVRGFSDPTAIKLPDGKPVLYQPDPLNPDGYLLPYHLNTANTAAAAIPSTSHAWQVQHEAYADGKMDAWLKAHIAADGTTNARSSWATTSAATSRSSSPWRRTSPSATTTTVRCSARRTRTGSCCSPAPSTLTVSTAARRKFSSAEPGSRLYDLGMASYPNRFEYDAVNDNLPAVSWIGTTGAG